MMTSRWTITLRRRPAGQAFTVPEMLAVIAVVSIVLALLLPQLNRAKESARQAICASNARQMVIGHGSYLLDNGGVSVPSETNSTIPHWLQQLSRYTNVDEIRDCPSTEGLRGDPGAAFQYWGSARHDWHFKVNTYGIGTLEPEEGSYMANFWTNSTTGWGENIALHFKRRSETPSASTVPLYCDGIWHGGFPKDSDTSLIEEAYGAQAPGGQITRVLIQRHRQAINVAFYDGSARLVPLRSMWSLTWHKGFKTKDNVHIPWLN